MMIWFSLLLFGGLLYFIVQHRVTRITRAPWWLLWFVLMLPVFLVTGWRLAYGTATAMPPALLIGCFLISFVVYSLLVSLNPRTQPAPEPETASSPAPQPPVRALPTGPMSQLSSQEKAQLKTCFPWSAFYLQDVDYRPQVVICRGQLRSQPEEAYRTITDNIKTQFGNRFLVIFQLGPQNHPFFAVIPNPTTKITQRVIFRPGLALGLLLATACTTLLAGGTLAEPNIQWNPQVLIQNPAALQQGLLFSLAVILILGSRSLGQYFMAWRYRIKTSLPYFIPIPFIFGTVGAFVQMRAPVPHRRALFDVGVVGPIASFLATLPLLLWGLSESTLADLPSEATAGWSLTPFDPTASVLFALLCKLVFQANLVAGQGIVLHPLAIAGGIGLIYTAFNLMPVGQLDGGRIVHAMFGQRNGAIIGQISRFLLLVLGFAQLGVSGQRLLLVGAIGLWLLPAVDEPTLNDVSELDNRRDLLGLLLLALLLVIILPVPGFAARLLLPSA